MVDGGRPPTALSGWEWQLSQSCRGATELVFSGPALGQMQSEPSGDRAEASSEGLGGYQLLAQTDAARSSGPATVLAVKKDGQFRRDTNHAM